jgi:hypothetical protein
MAKAGWEGGWWRTRHSVCINKCRVSPACLIGRLSRQLIRKHGRRGKTLQMPFAPNEPGAIEHPDSLVQGRGKHREIGNALVNFHPHVRVVAAVQAPRRLAAILAHCIQQPIDPGRGQIGLGRIDAVIEICMLHLIRAGRRAGVSGSMRRRRRPSGEGFANSHFRSGRRRADRTPRSGRAPR